MRKNLKEARQKAGMTQQKMADKLEISLRYYQHNERAAYRGLRHLGCIGRHRWCSSNNSAPG